MKAFLQMDNTELQVVRTRKEALAVGEKYYFTGEPCIRGHIANRIVRNHYCAECKKIRVRLDSTKKRQRNPEAVRLSRRRSVSKNPVAHLLIRARQRAKKCGFQYSITATDVPYDVNCPCCGVEMNVSLDRVDAGRANPNTPSLDRLDSREGYVPGNVRVICWRCNDVKGNATIEELWAVLNWMTAETGKRSHLRLVA